MLLLDIFEEEIEKTKQNPGKMKMKLQCVESGRICIDISRMEYVENKNESNRG